MKQALGITLAVLVFLGALAGGVTYERRSLMAIRDSIAAQSALIERNAAEAKAATKDMRPTDALYSAVFLTNGQVYFGKLEPGAVQTRLTDIYYMNPAEGNNISQTPGGSSISLVKFGSEVHDPRDEMVIQNTQILFTETLKDTGKVVMAIKDYNAR